MTEADSRLEETCRMLRQMAAESKMLTEAAGGSVTDATTTWLAPQYLLATREKLSGTQGDERWAILRAVLQDWSLLRRGEHSAARLRLDREELDWRRENSRVEREQQFREWLNDPEVRKEFLPDLARGIRPETIARIERELNLL